MVRKVISRIPALIISLVAFCNIGVAQEKLLKRSWIKSSIEELGKGTTEPDTAYLRYVFTDRMVLYGFEPAWHSGMQIPYEVKGNKVKLAFDQWTIETLTDSTLTIFLKGFRRMKFFSEEYLRSKHDQIEQIGEHNGKPLYKPNRIITPRYLGSNPLANDIAKEERSDYNVRKAGTFRMTFVVTAEGNIEDPKILAGVAEGFDKKIINELMKTSRRWTPAVFEGQAVQTLIMFDIEYLDSF